MQQVERKTTKDARLFNAVNLYWDGVQKEPIYFFDKIGRFASVWLNHSDNKVNPTEFDPDAWIEHHAVEESKKKLKVKSK